MKKTYFQGSCLAVFLMASTGLSSPLMADAWQMPAARSMSYQPASGADASVAGTNFNYLGALSAPNPNSTANPVAVAALVASISEALTALPQGARVEDYEAAIAFALDQSSQPPEVTTAALAQIRAQANSLLASRAINGVRLARQRSGSVGTGAIAGDAVTLTLGTDDAPAVILSGGSNYS